MKFCILCGQSRAADIDIRLFRVPKDDERRKMWIKAVGKYLPPSSLVCSTHFDRKYIGRQKLLKDTIPLCISSDNQSKLPVYAPSSSTLQDPDTHFPNLPSSPNQKINIPDITDYDLITNLFILIKNYDLTINLPHNWSMHKLENHIVFSKLGLKNNSPYLERTVVLTEETISAQVMSRAIDVKECVTTVEDLETYIRILNEGKLCTVLSQCCFVFISDNRNECIACTKFKYRLRMQKKKCTVKVNKRELYLKNKNKKLHSVIKRLRKEHNESRKIEYFIKDLPKTQKEMVKMCYDSSLSRKNGIRYSLDWVYSCILMRIKSTKLYNYMRENKILPLPSRSTLSRYIRNIDGSFGFQNQVFEMLKEKTCHMQTWERHGCLLVDECKVSTTKKFDKNTMDFIGFIDLGKHTPQKMENKLGDHALVIMFQPFAGHGLQALACFLSGGDISGDVLSKIMLECVILCENSGLFIDAITSDGASWNRKMWKHLGVEDPNKPWCEHPMDESRKLRMCSDFPHLIKCLRNNLMSKKKFRIPEGLVEFSHFENLLKYESDKMFKMAFKLTASHIYPSYGQKMNTRLAFQLFSNKTAQALRIYQSSGIFSNVDPTITFCEKINTLIDIMNSSKPLNGLRQNSKEYEELDSFLIYLDLWEQISLPDSFISKSTFEGLKATLACTLDLCTYLSNFGFKYLMTSRLNQDHLEHFFGMMRAAGGCNSHPESLQVGQIFRLMSLYSLIKPPRGSNVTGGDMMKSLLKIGDLKGKRQKLEFDLEIEGNFSGFVEEFPEIEEAFAYFCGYVAKKIKNTTDCSGCISTIVGDGNEKYNQFIKNISRGYLTFPSQNIIHFLHEIEMKISDIFEKELNRNCLLEVLYRLSYFTPKSVIGCMEHRNEISKYALQAYLISRMSISCKREHNERAKKNKSKHYAKLAKLY